MNTDEFIKSKLWLLGPEFLRQPPECWPVNPVADCVDSEVVEREFLSCNLVADGVLQATAMDRLLDYFSQLHRLKLATAWFLRFKSFLRSKVKDGGSARMSIDVIAVEELRVAEMELVKFTLRKHFPDCIAGLSDQRRSSKAKASPIYHLGPILVHGVLRVRGRLKNVKMSYEAGRPAIRPRDCHLTKLVIDFAHSSTVGHFGVNSTLNELNQRYWIVRARVAVHRVLRDCLFCKRRGAKPGQQIMADLPPSMLQRGHPPFAHTGVDYFGPILIKQRRSEVKRYGCLFTCMTTRAVHLEVSVVLSTDSFINCLCRFIARRGRPTHVYSDNGTNFVGCRRTLHEAIDNWNKFKIQDHLRQKDIVWKLIVPGASHIGVYGNG